MESPLLNIEEAAVLLCVPVRMIRRMISDRRIPVTKIGRYVRISRDDLNAYIAANRREAEAS